MLETGPDTRARILEAALHEFAERGFHATSLRQIAERVAITKTAVLYHFPSKAEILAALVDPMLLDLERAGADARGGGAVWATVESVLEVFIQHRYLLRLNMRDLALVGAGPQFQRFQAAMIRANLLVAGPKPSFARRVRAAQAIAMLSDPVVLFADAPIAALRSTVLDGVRRLLQGRKPARARSMAKPSGARGRPKSLEAAQVQTAKRLHATGLSANDIASRLGVSRATIYRHIADF